MRKGQLEASLLEFEKEIFEEWKMLIETNVPKCMNKTLLRRSTDKLLILNFDETVRNTYCIACQDQLFN